MVSIVPFSIDPPQTGGQRTVWGACAHYARQLDDFACLAVTTLRSPRARGTVPFRYREFRLWSSLLIASEYLRLFPKIPYLWAMRFAAPRLAKEALACSPDVIEVYLPWLMAIRHHIPTHIPVVLATQNVESEWYRPYIERGLFPNVFSRWMRAMESEGLKLADHIVCLTQQDQDVFHKQYAIPRKRMTTIPIGYEPTPASPRVTREMRSRKKVLFVGSCTPSNIDAALQLVRHIAPSCEAFADFVVAGRVGKALRAEKTGPNVEITGFVSNLEALYETVDLFLNPINMELISNGKVIEALGMGIRTIVTPGGARGFEELMDGPLLVGSLAEIPGLIKQAQPLSIEDRRRISMFRWESIAKRRIHLYQSVAAQHAGAGAG
ncbi:MAG: glycosyltransferase family 4 protein [Kiritimatiellia bacterium]|nr:glycosyltransferase family 4 protein [Kiritimatiellia bacterium]MDP7024887.1 glycosyltransferase family 4 protein [Kiritimatiellia bacterium]